MKKVSLFFTLLLGAMVCFTSCSDDELTPEEKEAKQKEELLVKITANYDAVTAKKWELKEFQPSADMQAAAETEDGLVAKTIIVKAKQAPNFNMVLSFVDESNMQKVAVTINVPESEMEARLIAYQDSIAGFEAGFLYETPEFYMASVRRVVAAPFAPDDAEIEDIVNEDTGECILKIKKRDFSSLSYEDIVLSQKQLVAGNSDKIYINEDGTLTVETTSVEFGVSKYIYNEVTE